MTLLAPALLSIRKGLHAGDKPLAIATLGGAAC